jgi:hypothetical protein
MRGPIYPTTLPALDLCYVLVRPSSDSTKLAVILYVNYHRHAIVISILLYLIVIRLIAD